MTPSVPSSDVTTATAGTSAARTLVRNRLVTTMTRLSAISSVISTSCSDARIVIVRSIATSSLMSPGRSASSSGNSARTASTVSMMFAAGWRVTFTITAGLPLKRPSVWMSSAPSTTFATSPKRTAAPLRYAITRLR